MDRNGHPHVSDTRLWQHACESFVGGVFHAIGSRVSALSGIGALARMGQDLDGLLLSLLDDEIAHLTDTLDASRILPRAPTAREGPSQVASVLPRVLRLLELNLEARRLEFDYEGPEEGADVEMDGTTVVHSLASLLMCLGWSAAGGPETELRVRLLNAGEEVVVAAEVIASPADREPESAEGPSSAPPEGVIAEGLAAIRAEAEAYGGSLDVDCESCPRRFELRLPSLGRSG